MAGLLETVEVLSLKNNSKPRDQCLRRSAAKRLAYLAGKGSASIFVSKNVSTTVCRCSPVLRHLSRIGHSLSTDADLHDRGLDLRPAAFDGSWDRPHPTHSQGAGLLNCFQYRSRRCIHLSVCPSDLAPLVAWRCRVARSWARSRNNSGWFESG